jgi:hypothetical protein
MSKFHQQVQHQAMIFPLPTHSQIRTVAIQNLERRSNGKKMGCIKRNMMDYSQFQASIQFAVKIGRHR